MNSRNQTSFPTSHSPLFWVAALALAFAGFFPETAAARYCEALFDNTKALPSAELESPLRDYNHLGPSFYNPRHKWNGGKDNRHAISIGRALTDPPSRLPIEEIHFMQSTASNNMSLAGFTVLDTARKLKSSDLAPEDITTVRVWRDSIGRVWTLDHRRLAAMHMANVREVPVVWASEKIIQRESYKKGTVSAGRFLLVRFADEQGILVGKTNPRSPLSKTQKRKLLSQLVTEKKTARNPLALMNDIRDLHLEDLVSLKSLALKEPSLTPSTQKRIIESLQRKNSDQSHSPIVLRLSEIRAQSDVVNTSDSFISAAILKEAKRLQDDITALAKIKPVRIWQDSFGRVWTPETEKLAMLRLALSEDARIPVEWADEATLPLNQRAVTSQTLGRSLVIPIRDLGIGIVTVMDN